MMIRALGLARVSTAEQGTPEHFSLDHQQQVIRDYAHQQGLVLVDVVAYIQSGGSNRGTLQQVLHRVESEAITVVLVAELDRLSRDLVTTMSFIEELHALGGNLVAIKEGFDPRDPLGQLQTAIIGTFAQYFRAQLSHKVKGGQEERWRQGKFSGGVVPYGYRMDAEGRLAIDPAQAAVVRQVFTWYLEDDWGYRRICEALTDRGLVTARGQAWSIRRIRYILQNETYAGHLIRGKTIAHKTVSGVTRFDHPDAYAVRPHNHPAIIDTGTFAAVQKRLQTKQRLGPRSRKSRYLLSGVIRCGLCGSPMGGNASYHKPYYICTAYKQKGRMACDGSSRIMTGYAERVVLDALQDERQAVRTAFTPTHWLRWSALDPRTDAWWQEKAQRDREHQDAAARLDRAKEAYLAGLFTLADFEAVKAQVAEPPCPVMPYNAQDLVLGIITRTIAWYQEALAAPDPSPYRGRVQEVIQVVACHPHQRPVVQLRTPPRSACGDLCRERETVLS